MATLSCLASQCPHGQGKGADKQKANRRRQGEGRGLKTGKNVRTSPMDDPKEMLGQIVQQAFPSNVNNSFVKIQCSEKSRERNA